MAETFADLGLRPELVAEAEAAGFAFPTPLQRAAMPVLRRGGNAVLHASEGAGVTAAYGLALLDRLAGEPAGAAAGGGAAIRAVDGERGERGERALQAVVLVPLDEAAARIAIFLARFARPLGLRVLALERDWPPVRTGADVLVAAPAALLEAIQKSLVKLDAVRAFVVHGASTMLSLIRREVLEDIANSMPREAQRVLTSGELSAAVEDYIERHVRRPLRFGGRAAEPAAAG
ncbi:MAG: DEAD/DEAH box helicase, partial [Gemmatimonadetes bacterium]|nr:DEAD/DEAH box helicase [Gemmatimonadota bacterium]